MATWLSHSRPRTSRPDRSTASCSITWWRSSTPALFSRSNTRRSGAMARIQDIAQVCLSNNAGAFDLTIDVAFDDPAMFEKVKATGVLCPALFAKLYGVEESQVLFTVYDPGYAFKATLPRLRSAGDIGDTDVYGAQQPAPVLDVDIPL